MTRFASGRRGAHQRVARRRAGTPAPEPGNPGDQALAGLPAVWLRANCPCPDATVEVVFGPDGHRSVSGRDWLARCTGPADPADPAADSRVDDAKHLWPAADLGHELAQGWWPRYLADPPHRAACLSAVLTEGLVVLHDVPCEPGAAADGGGGHRRHLQGCYADLGGLESALAVAARGLRSGQPRPGQARP